MRIIELGFWNFVSLQTFCFKKQLILFITWKQPGMINTSNHINYITSPIS